MPLPTPQPNEPEKKFVSRCIAVLHESEKDRFTSEQIAAICFSQWRKHTGEGEQKDAGKL